MPGNQNVSSSLGVPISQPKCNLVRSKSLRLSTPKPKPEASTSTLTRHGSIRAPKSQIMLAPGIKPFSTSKKPPLKPKPSFCNSKSTENLDKSIDSKRLMTGSMYSPTRHIEGRSHILSEFYRAPSDSPTSLPITQYQDINSWCTSDLAAHLKRLTEEHDKLQVEHARLRTKFLEGVPFSPSLSQCQRQLSQSDSQLATVPESGTAGTQQETLLQNYRTEMTRLQEENRRLQRKYWDQILNSESVDDEQCNGASQQIVDLIDKLEDKEKELREVSGKVQELENHLTAATWELQQCMSSNSDLQRALDEATSSRDSLVKQTRECRSRLIEARENAEFLQNERFALSEAFQEAEQALQVAKAERVRDLAKLNEVMDRARKLYAKVKEKDLQVDVLRAELERTQGTCRDALLSQGAELTNASLHLSRVAIQLHTQLVMATDFAATHLDLQKEMLEEMMADHQDIEDSESPKENGAFYSDSQVLNSMASSLSSESFKSLPDISGESPPPNEGERRSSLVQSMVRAYEQSTIQSHSNSLPRMPLEQTSGSMESLSVSVNGDLNKDLSNRSNSSCAFKPVGKATAFRPARSTSSEPPPTAEEKSSFEAQLAQVQSLVSKVSKVVELMLGKFGTKVQFLEKERAQLQEELASCKSKQFEIQSDLINKNYDVEKANALTEDIIFQLRKAEKEYAAKKEVLIEENLKLKEELKCLEAMNAEQAGQLKNNVLEMMEKSSLSEPNGDFLANADVICVKMKLQQQIAKLEATIAQKDTIIQQVSHKYKKTTSSLEENLKKSENEIEVLDNLITKIFLILETNSELVQKHDVLKSIHALVSGNGSLANISVKEDASDVV